MLKSNGTPLLLLAALLCVGSVVVSAQTFTTVTEWAVPTASSEPLQIVAAGTNGAYFTERTASKIGSLDLKKNVMIEWSLPAGTAPHGLALQGQRVAFGEQRGEVGLLDPNASTVTEWPIPQVNSVVPSAYHVAVQGKYIFYSDWNQGVIGMVNTSSNELTQWQLPGAPIGRAPNGLVVTGSSSAIQVWAADQGANKIILLTPANNTYTEWLIPGLDSDFTLQHVDVASDGTILFQDNDFNFVARLNPFTNIVQTWTIPTVFSSPNAVASLSAGTMVFDEGAGNKIGTLDLSTAPTSQAAVLPTQTVVLPNVQVVAPTVTAVAQSATTVSPTLTGASRNVVGGFNEYPIPTAFSGPDGVAISNGKVLFTESSFAANKIGLLR